MRWVSALVLFGVSIATGGCLSSGGDDPYRPRAVREVSRWDAWFEQRPVGQLLLLEIENADEPIRFYRVENDGAQWVGYIDLYGRTYKRVPFQEEEQFIGVFPMREGAAVLLELDGVVELVERTDEDSADGGN